MTDESKHWRRSLVVGKYFLGQEEFGIVFTG